MKRTAVSLFAGVGGFDLALERNGVEVVANVEIDKHARAVLAKQFPKATQFNDVMEVTGEQLRTAGFISDGGIITGGFPCQDLSVAGKRLGFTGKRSSLFYQIARIADETKAEWLVLENVPGLLTSQRGADMGAVVGTLVELGYCLSWRVLDAQHFGVPQRRRRVFIVARRSGDPTSTAEVLFERQGLRGDIDQSRTPREEVAASSGEGASSSGFFSIQGSVIGRSDSAGPGGRGYSTPDEPMFTLNTIDRHAIASEPVRLYEPILAFSSGQSSQARGLGIQEDIAPPLRACGGNNSMATILEPVRLYEPHHGDGRVTENIANTLAARMGTGGNNTPVLIDTYVKTHRATSSTDAEIWKADDTHPTLNQFDVGDSRCVTAITKLNTVRRITPLECERLQGFPDGWTDGQADSHRYKQMGNAVAVPVVEWVINGIVNVD